ncbi:MAG: hypothetical protein AB8F74_05855 [Saprospiraceae bacterium]
MKKIFILFSFYSLALFLSLSFFFTIYYLLEFNAVIGVSVSAFFLLITAMLVSDKEFIQDIEE